MSSAAACAPTTSSASAGPVSQVSRTALQKSQTHHTVLDTAEFLIDNRDASQPSAEVHMPVLWGIHYDLRHLLQHGR